MTAPIEASGGPDRVVSAHPLGWGGAPLGWVLHCLADHPKMEGSAS